MSTPAKNTPAAELSCGIGAGVGDGVAPNHPPTVFWTEQPATPIPQATQSAA
jgi:hypothetical protein